MRMEIRLVLAKTVPCKLYGGERVDFDNDISTHVTVGRPDNPDKSFEEMFVEVLQQHWVEAEIVNGDVPEYDAVGYAYDLWRKMAEITPGSSGKIIAYASIRFEAKGMEWTHTDTAKYESSGWKFPSSNCHCRSSRDASAHK